MEKKDEPSVSSPTSSLRNPLEAMARVFERLHETETDPELRDQLKESAKSARQDSQKA